MELRDLIVTPLVIILIYLVAFALRPYVTNGITRRYFLPGLTVRIIGALAVGFIYQFYYHGGDTFNYHTHGSRHIWEAFVDDPSIGLKLFLSNGEYGPGLWDKASKIWYYGDEHSYVIVRTAAIFDLFTFSSYSGTAVLFSLCSFIGAWMLFLTFYKMYPDLHRWIALSTLFIPTVIFWGSGIFKDSLTLAGLGAATFTFYNLFILRKIRVPAIFVFLFSCWIIFTIKKYILLSFLPALLLWVFFKYTSLIQSLMVKIIVAPLIFLLALFMIYNATLKVTEDDPRYNITKLAQTAKITAYDIRYGWGARGGEGSGYTLGELDGTWQSMLKLMPQAINVSLFRPYLWEVKNPLMLLSALEALILFALTLFVGVSVRSKIFKYLQKPEVLFCLMFSLIFAFAVGVSTFNFGTLSRYKIPMMPYFMLAIGLIYNYWKSDKKLSVLDNTE